MVKEQSIAPHIIFGLGKSGLSCARYFDRIEQQYSLIDTRHHVNRDSLAGLTHCVSSFFGNLSFDLIKNCQQLVVSPGISLDNPLIKKALNLGIDVCGDIELFVRECHKPIVAITGSNGKSTVTDLSNELISHTGINCQKGGNIGLPVLDFLPQQKADLYLLELSSFQLDTTDSLSAEVALILNISEDHMDRYGGFEHYIQSKQKIYKNAKRRIFNWQDSHTFPSAIGEQDFAFSQQAVKDQTKAKLSYLKAAEQGFDCFVDHKKILNSTQLKLTGRHNLSNVLASLCILDCLNIAISPAVIKALENYQGLAHRFQLVSRHLNCEWVDDSKATNVGATLAAINSVTLKPYSQLFLIAGGDSKQSDLSPLKEALNSRVTHLILIGKDAEKLAKLVPAHKTTVVANMKSAVQKARSLCHQEDVILLSPACSSLDMYPNFEARGLDFQKAVRECA